MVKLNRSVAKAGGWWTYWYKSPDNIDISFCKNKNAIPKGARYVRHFYNDRDRYIINEKGDVVWKEKIGKQGPCDARFAAGAVKLQEEIHKALGADFPRKEYAAGIKKSLKKRCAK